MKIKNIPINEESIYINVIKKDIEAVFNNLSYEPIWQTIAWNEMLQKSNYVSKGFFIGVYDDFENLENFMIIEKRSIGFKNFSFFIIGGPINEKHLSILEEEIINLSKIEKVVYCQLEPLIEFKFKGFKDINLKKFIEPCTVILDLKKTEEELLSEMKPKGRYNIKIAEKSSVIIEKVINNEENLQIFYDLLSETNSRDLFSINSKNYFKNFLDYIYEYKIGGLYFAKKDNEIIAAGIFIMLQKTCYYYYGASTSDNNKRKFMASYLLQWRLIQEAKEKGCVYYDFLGVTCPNLKKSRLAGVTDFKLKFSEKITRWPNSQIYVNKKIVFSLFFIKYKLKNFFKI